jgi:hypothetical protein
VNAIWALRAVAIAGLGVTVCIGLVGGLFLAATLGSFNPWNDATLGVFEKVVVWPLARLTMIGALVGPIAVVALAASAFVLPSRPSSPSRVSRANRAANGLLISVLALGLVWWFPILQFGRLALDAMFSVAVWAPAGPGDWSFRRQIGAIALGALFPLATVLVLYLRFLWLPRVSAGDPVDESA